jgi:hypothetical protein
MGLRKHRRVTTWVRPHGSLKKDRNKGCNDDPVFSETFNRVAACHNNCSTGDRV